MAQDQLFASFLLDSATGLEIALRAGSVIEAAPLPSAIKPLPGGVEFLEGIMQHREQVVPVVNLKKRFGLKESGYGPEAKIALVSLFDQPLGLMVDDIREVFRAEPEAVVPVNPMLQAGEKLISAVIRLKGAGRTAELLDLRGIFSRGVMEAESGGAAALAQAAPRRQITWSRFVVFRCGGREYGVPVAYAQEITFLAEIDELFGNAQIEGSLNLRERVVPVMDAARLLTPSRNIGTVRGEDCRILVLNLQQCWFGLIVEEIREILAVDTESILALPAGQEGYLGGIFPRTDGGNVLLLDVPALVDGQLADLCSMSRLKNHAEGTGEQGRGRVATTRHLITENCYLVFKITKHFAVELKDVREIIESENILEVPGNSGYRSGVINLRGQVVPVINLRRFYNFPEASEDAAEGGRLIICHGHGRMIALAVDAIVTICKQEQYHATPSLHPKMVARKDTLDRLIEFSGGDGMVEHVLVVNVSNLIRNHLETASGRDEGT